MSGCHYPYISICKHDIDPRVQECCHCEIEKRISKLEKKMNEPIKQCTCDELEKALKIRNKEFFDLKEEVRNIMKKISDDGYKPKPHQCPVCDGHGVQRCLTLSAGNHNTSVFNCKSCNGKGIVWG